MAIVRLAVSGSVLAGIASCFAWAGSEIVVPWPADRETVDAGTLTVAALQSEAAGHCRDVNFDPLMLPRGIAPSDDPLLRARSAAYAISHARRGSEPGQPGAVRKWANFRAVWYSARTCNGGGGQAMKLGLYMATQWRQGADLGPELENLIEQVRTARASGLASLMVGQHFVSSPLQMFQAMPLLARLAAEAGGMRLGPGLLLLPLLNPVVVAEETATLDWLTGGNAIIGLGLGYRQEEFDSIGIPFKERVPRFVEGVEVIRKLWRDDVVEHRGRFHTLTRVQASIRPKQPGGPPIWMAGDVEAAVRRAGKLADAWMPSPMVSEENVGRLGALFRETRQAAGLAPATEFPIIRECHVGSMDEVREPLGFKYEAYAAWSGESGFVPKDGIRADFDKFARNRFIIGSESEVVDQIGRYGERTGTDHILLRVQWPGLDQKTAVRTLEQLGRVAEKLC